MAAGENTVTRERMFFNRLYYDLKLAAARCGYPLMIFEPEVDRDSYDIVVDDGDQERRFQLKTVLHDAGTSSWKVTKRLLRPGLAYCDALRIAPADSGFGGGILLIEIDVNSNEPSVRYAFTDYFILCGLQMRLWLEAARSGPRVGRPPKKREVFAANALEELARGLPREEIALERQLFVNLKSTDALLALLGFHSTADCYLPANGIMQAISQKFSADEGGKPTQGLELESIRLAEHHAKEILELLEEPELQTFDAPPQKNGESGS